MNFMRELAKSLVGILCLFHLACESLGTIEPGKLADLVLLDADPLQEIRNTQRIRAVVADGRLFRRADLDQLLVEVQKLMHSGD